ncbi:MAG: hypothetical protein AAFR90_06690, partial [Pseudomonadota bacterium]
ECMGAHLPPGFVDMWIKITAKRNLRSSPVSPQTALRNEYKLMPTHQFNPKEYLSDLDHLDMSENEKLVFIETLHSVIHGFAAYAWGRSPAQSIDQLCPPQNGKQNQTVLLCSRSKGMSLVPPANDNEDLDKKEKVKK